MLVLTRRIGEEIVIADHIRVVVLAVDGRKVRLGINAPASVGVVRQELLGERRPGTAPERSEPALSGCREES